MSSQDRRTREKENLRRAILDAARELFTHEGYYAVSMRKIAEKIEYSPTSIYLYFRDKEEVLFHLVQEGFELLKARLNECQDPDPVERLRQGGYAYLKFCRDHPQYFHLMFQAKNAILIEKVIQLQRFELPELYGYQEEMGQRCFLFILDCVVAAIEQNKFAPGNPLVLAHTIWAQVHGAACLENSGCLFMLPEDFHQDFRVTLIEAIIKGMRE